MARPPKKERGIYARKDADGKTLWYCRVYLNGREHRLGPFETKTDAKNKRDDLRSEHRLGKVDPEGGWQLLGDLIDRHLKLKASKKDQVSQQRFSHWWQERFKAKGLKRVKDLSVRILEEARDELKTELIKQGSKRALIKRRRRTVPVRKEAQPAERYRSPATVNRYFVWLRSMLKPAKQKRRELFDDWEWEREPKGRVRHLSREEEAVLLTALGPAFGPWARFAILTGLRQAEQFRLEWKHVDLERGILTLPETKAGHVQYVQLSGEAQAILRGFDSWQRSKWVFPSENPAAPMDARNFYQRVWIPAVKRVGIEWATWHDLRHTFASRLALGGQNETTIAALLRHSTTALVRRYAHLSQPHLKAAAEVVSRYGSEVQSGESESKTGKKPETAGSVGERNGKPEAAEVGVGEGEIFGAPDTN